MRSSARRLVGVLQSQRRYAVLACALVAFGVWASPASSTAPPPTIHCSPASDVPFWHASNETVTCSASDPGGPGLANPGADANFQLHTSAPAGTEATFNTDTHQVCDTANNCSTAGPYAFNIDLKAPVSSCSPTSDTTTWHATDVVVNCTATDMGSGLFSPATDSSFTVGTNAVIVPPGTETANAMTTARTVCDNVGNCAVAGPFGPFMVDKKGPTVTCAATPSFTPNQAGAQVSATVTDGGSGPAASPVYGAADTSSPGAHSASVTGADKVGNTTTVSCPYTVLRATSTSVVCVPASVAAGSPSACTATVTDGDVGTPSVPGGSVSFTSSSTDGVFSGTGMCTLSGVSASASSCSINWTPTNPTHTAPRTDTIMGAYAPSDGVHAASNSNSGPANGSVLLLAPPVISKVFGAASIPFMGSTTLSFTIQNPNPSTTLHQVGFTDTLPSGLVVASPNGLSGSCLGLINAGSSTVSLSDEILAGGGSCTFQVNVTGTTPGTKNNQTSAVRSFEAGFGNQAMASLTVTNGCPSGQPAFIYPSNGQAGVDGSVPFSWCAVTGAQYYYLTIGTGGGGYDVVNSGNLPGTQTSFNTGMLPAGRTLYARVWAYVNGAWRTQDISFTTPAVAPGMFTYPVNGQTGVTAPHLFTWTASPQAQFYYLTVGTTGAGYDVVNSGNLPSTQTSYNVTSLPAHRTLYARLYSYINGNWVTQDISFST